MISMQCRATAQLSVARRPLVAPALMAAPRRAAAARRGQPVVTWAAASKGAAPDSRGQRMKRPQQPSSQASNIMPYRKGAKSGSLSSEEAAELAAALQPLAALAGMGAGAPKGLVSKLAAMTQEERSYVLRHGTEVAELLLAVGLEGSQLAALLAKCPELFAWPAAAQGRLPPRFEELVQLLEPYMAAKVKNNPEAARLKQAATVAARCFSVRPAAARKSSFAAAIDVLAPAGSSPNGGMLTRQQLADLLKADPAAVELLYQPAGQLAQRRSDIVQRYSQSWNDRKDPRNGDRTKLKSNQQVLAAALKRDWHFMLTDWSHFLETEELLQQEIGLQPGDGTRFVGYCIMNEAKLLHPTNDKARKMANLRQKAQALVAEFGRPLLCGAPPTGVPGLLYIATATWQLDLAVWKCIGVREPKRLAINNPKTVFVNWLSPDRLAIVLALQCKLPGQLSTAEVIERFALIISSYSAKRLIGRLLYLQHEGLLDRLVLSKGGKADRDELISLDELAGSTDSNFLSLVAAARGPNPKRSPTAFLHFVSTIMPRLPEYKDIIKRSQVWSCEIAAQLEQSHPALLDEAAKARASGKHVKKARSGY